MLKFCGTKSSSRNACPLYIESCGFLVLCISENGEWEQQSQCKHFLGIVLQGVIIHLCKHFLGNWWIVSLHLTRPKTVFFFFFWFKHLNLIIYILHSNPLPQWMLKKVNSNAECFTMQKGVHFWLRLSHWWDFVWWLCSWRSLAGPSVTRINGLRPSVFWTFFGNPSHHIFIKVRGRESYLQDSSSWSFALFSEFFRPNFLAGSVCISKKTQQTRAFC